MEVLRPSEMLTSFHIIAWCHNPEENYLNFHRHEKHKSYIHSSNSSRREILDFTKVRKIGDLHKLRNSLCHNILNSSVTASLILVVQIFVEYFIFYTCNLCSPFRYHV